MNLERLRAVQAEEREADSLRALPDSFYQEVAEYIEALRGERASAAEAAADPFDSAEVRRLTDEIENAEEVAEAIYERRVGKLVKRASLAAAGMPADESGLTTEEAELFSTLVDRIEAHREDVLATFDGERDVDLGSGGSPEPAAVDRAAESHPGDDESSEAVADGTDPSSGAGSERDGHDEAPPPPPDEPVSDDDPEPTDAASDDAAAAADEPTRGADTERLTLRITADVGEVFGVDERVYDLAEEDVVTLPAANAKPLLERDAAERVE